MAGKAVIITSDDWYFLSHRLPVAAAFRELGMETIVVTGPGTQGDQIWGLGYRHHIIPKLDRRNRSVKSNIEAVIAIGRYLEREKPDIIFAVSLRFGLLAMLADRFYLKSKLINLMPGLGFVFSSQKLSARFLKPIAALAMRIIFSDPRYNVIVQNRDNLTYFRSKIGIPAERIRLIAGSGILIKEALPMPPTQGAPVVALVGRMLWSKGVREFIDAAKILRNRKRNVRMVLVGLPDAANPDSVPIEKLTGWDSEGVVEWWGFQDDIVSVWAKAKIGVFPTWYGEGIPKALLEAGACGRPVIATNVAGCRDVIVHEENGILIPTRSAAALANAIERLLSDEEACARMAARLASHVQSHFDETTVKDETRSFIVELLDSNPDVAN